MAVALADKLIKRAESGERLTSKERRHCVAYLGATGSDRTNPQIADLFQVSERMIRLDRRAIREERAKVLKEEDVGLVVADIAINAERQIRDIEAGKRKCKIGSRDYLEYCKAIVDVQLKTVKALQDLGYYPKNIGNLTVEKYEYKATVAKDESLDQRPLDLKLDAGDIHEAEFTEVPVETPLLLEQSLDTFTKSVLESDETIGN